MTLWARRPPVPPGLRAAMEAPHPPEEREGETARPEPLTAPGRHVRSERAARVLTA